MAHTKSIRISTGHYRIKATSHEVKQLSTGKWQLLDVTGEEIGVFSEMRQAVGYSESHPNAEAGATTPESSPAAGAGIMPPSQPRNIEELAAVLAAIRRPAAGHHYIVIEVPDRLTS